MLFSSLLSNLLIRLVINFLINRLTEKSWREQKLTKIKNGKILATAKFVEQIDDFNLIISIELKLLNWFKLILFELENFITPFGGHLELVSERDSNFAILRMTPNRRNFSQVSDIPS